MTNLVCKTVELHIISNNKANNLLVNSLFEGRKTLSLERYDLGKYAKSGIGETAKVQQPSWGKEYIALVAVRRKDKDGPYYAMYVLVKYLEEVIR